MDPFRTETGVAAPLPASNVDTDVIMPKQFLKGITRDGLARGAFHHLRFDDDGNELPDFVLNRPGFREARFLVVGPNFGCGSSREHAVWGLKQYGIRAIIGTTYGSIFYDNCFQNGLLAAVLTPADHEALLAACSAGDPVALTVDLTETAISAPGLTLGFEVDPLRRERLLNGLDTIGATLQSADAIREFETGYLAAAPWVRAGGS